MTLQFTHADGLHFDGTVPGTYGRITNNPLHRDASESGFELTDENGIWHSAEATIIAGLHRSDHDDPDSNHDAHSAPRAILLHSPAVAHPTAVRYAWRSWGPAPLFNRDGLPAPPFLQQIEKHGETMQ